MEKLLITADEAANLLSLSRSQVFNLAARNTIPTVRIGRSVRFPLGALREWIEEQRQSGAAGVREPG